MLALDKKLLRDLWRIKAQGLAIAMVIGCGVATVVLMFGTMRSLKETKEAYYERYRFAEVFAAVKRAPTRLGVRIGRIPGVKRVQTRIVKDVILDVKGVIEPATGRLISIPELGRPLLNAMTLRRGRYISPGRPDEVIANQTFTEANGLHPGDHVVATINGRKRKLRIVGIALSPEYIYAIRPGELMPDNRRFAILWMSRDALEAAFDLKESFNDITLTLLRAASEDEVIRRLDLLTEPYGGTGSYGRRYHFSHSYLSSELDQLITFGWIMSPIFLAVAAFLLNVVVSRIVETERQQIGLLKAFGYTDWAVGWHYLKLILALTALGVIMGFLGGAWLGRGMTELYANLFHFPFLFYRPSPGIFAIAALVSVGAAMTGTLGAVRRAVRLPPAEAMLPAPPARYRKNPLEYLGMERLITEPTRIILRHLWRRPVRALLTTTGLAFSVAILVSSLFWLDAIEKLVDVFFFQAQRQDATLTFVEARSRQILNEVQKMPGVLAAEPYRTVPVRLRLGSRQRRLGITGIQFGTNLSRLLDARLRSIQVPSEGLVLSSKLAQLLDARRGDLIRVEAMEGRRPVVDVHVSAIIEEYLGVTAYMDMNALNRLMEEGSNVSGAYLLIDPLQQEELYREIKDTPAVAGMSLNTIALKTFRKTIGETIYIMLFFYTLFAGAIAFGVVYNSARILLSELSRDLASLRVLGFTRNEVSYILLGEILVLTLLALPVGCLIGYGMARMMTVFFDTDLYRIPFVVGRGTLGYSMLVVMISSLISCYLVRRRIDRLDLVAVLKTRE